MAAIDAVFINLDRAVERRAAIEGQLAKAALPYPVARLDAVDGLQCADCPQGLRPAQYGCWLSHLLAIERSIGSGAHLHVMEDDVLLGPSLERLPGILDAVDEGSGGVWDILFLDATLVEIADMQLMFEWAQLAREKQTVHVHLVPESFSLFGTHSYVVNDRRKREVLAFLQSHLHVGHALDGVLSYAIQTGALRAHLTAPYLTSGLDLGSATSSIAAELDERYQAWLIFRRLCFGELSSEALDALEARLGGIARHIGRAESLLGALMAYRMSRWPRVRFRAEVDRSRVRRPGRAP